MGKRSRDKGARFERELAKLFRALVGDEQVRRGRQDGKDRFTANTHEGDIVGVPGLWVEAKHVAARDVCPRPWWEQAQADAAGTGLEPIVVFRWDGAKPVVMIALATLRRWGVVFSLTQPMVKRVSLTRVALPEVDLLPAPFDPERVALCNWRVFEDIWRSRVS